MLRGFLLISESTTNSLFPTIFSGILCRTAHVQRALPHYILSNSQNVEERVVNRLTKNSLIFSCSALSVRAFGDNPLRKLKGADKEIPNV